MGRGPLRWSLVLATAAAAMSVADVGRAQQDEGRCLVNDPTGTPLNVRAAPNGDILTTLSNGMRVDPVDETRHNSKRWLLVNRFGERIGWVFGNYILCDTKGDAGDAAPTPPSDQR